jgi:hypothetical protein
MTRILDPTLRATPPRAATRASRPVVLRGAALGLLANGKTHGMTFLDRVAAELSRRHGVAELVRVTKANASAPAPADDAKALAARCAAIVTAIGD